MISLSAAGGDLFCSENLTNNDTDAGLPMQTYSVSSWHLRMRKMMPMMAPMKASAPRMPPMTAPVDGAEESCLFSSRHRGEKQREEREFYY